jgi:hypothetical protein
LRMLGGGGGGAMSGRQADHFACMQDNVWTKLANHAFEQWHSM